LFVLGGSSIREEGTGVGVRSTFPFACPGVALVVSTVVIRVITTFALLFLTRVLDVFLELLWRGNVLHRFARANTATLLALVLDGDAIYLSAAPITFTFLVLGGSSVREEGTCIGVFFALPCTFP